MLAFRLSTFMDNLNILSWNVRGLNARARQDDLRLLVEDYRAAIVCIQESKLEVVTERVMLSMLGVQFRDFAYLPASVTRGGIIVAARAGVAALSEVHIGCFSVTVRVRSTLDGHEWWLTSVYGPQGDSDKVLFLEELCAIRDACQGPWAVIGDFNLILETDKNNARINRRNLLRFRRTVEELELQDLHLHGRAYTWSNERLQPTLVKLDRALVSVDWEEQFPACFLQGLSSEASDHCPILLQTNAAVRSRPRFHFEIFWPQFDGYLEAVARRGAARMTSMILSGDWTTFSVVQPGSCRVGLPRRSVT